MNETDDYLPEDDDADESRRLANALREYESGLLTGRRPDREELLARYPGLGQDLLDGLDGLDFLHHAGSQFTSAQGLASVATRELATVPGGGFGTLGDFQLIREIGRGGMGVVYEAEQISLGRKVALKVLPFAATLDSRQFRRFENEARAAAQLHHPHIVPVYAVGCERGVHYYAMQLIEGRALSEWIATLRQQPRPAPPAAETARQGDHWTAAGTEHRGYFRAVARLGAQAADALEYAHQMGVVHRDIKPANLLLDGRDHLWVTDFGLARMQTHPGMTAPGDLVGTLRYMSPEQARGDPAIDPRSDVYALGATLYELATLHPMVDATDRQACLRQVLDDDPLPPSRINTALPPELEIIISKATAKSPGDRYSSAAMLADDLRRYLDDRPILARRPTLRDRANRWARRHRRSLGVAVAILAAAVPILAAATWRADRAERQLRAAVEQLQYEQDRTAKALEREAAQRAAAERSFREARQVLDYLTQLGESGLADRPELRQLRRELLEKLLGYYKEFVENHRDDPTTQAELNEAQYRVAAILAEVGSRSDAVAAYEQFRRGRERTPGSTPPLPFFRPRGVGLLALTLQPSVQKELRLTPEVIATLTTFADSRRSSTPGPDDDAQVEAKLAEFLPTQQIHRLRQIALQQRGPYSLVEPEVISALNLSETQQSRIREILDDARQRIWAMIGLGSDPDWRTKSEQFWHDVNERLLAVLSPEQRDIRTELLGEPFHGQIRFRWGNRPRVGESRSER